MSGGALGGGNRTDKFFPTRSPIWWCTTAVDVDRDNEGEDCANCSGDENADACNFRGGDERKFDFGDTGDEARCLMAINMRVVSRRGSSSFSAVPKVVFVDSRALSISASANIGSSRASARSSSVSPFSSASSTPAHRLRYALEYMKNRAATAAAAAAAAASMEWSES